MERLRDVLEKSQRATDKVTSIVRHTDAQLLELQGLMGPVQERAQSLSNAHKNLTTVRDETRVWLEHVGAISVAEARSPSGFEDEDHDDPHADHGFLRVLDKVVSAEVFFSHRRAFKGAEQSWRKAGTIANHCISTCEQEFAKLLRELHRERRRTSVGHGVNETRTTKKAPAPPPPFGSDAWETHVAARQNFSFSKSIKSPELASSMKSLSTPNVTDRKPSLSHQNAIHISTKVWRMPKRLNALARTLLQYSDLEISGSKRNGGDIEQIYVNARADALEEAMSVHLDAESLRGLEDHENSRKTKNVFRDSETFLADATRRVNTLERQIKKWSHEQNTARHIFSFDELLDDTENDTKYSMRTALDKLDKRGVDIARRVGPLVVDQVVRRALAWTHDLHAHLSNNKNPNSILASLHAKENLTRLRWVMETSPEVGVFSEAFGVWDTAVATAESASLVAFGLIHSFVETEAEKIANVVNTLNPKDAADATAAFVNNVAEFVTTLSECDNARAVLLREGVKEKQKREIQTQSQNCSDDDGILDFTDSDEDEDENKSTAKLVPSKTFEDEDAAFSKFASQVLETAVTAVAPVVERKTKESNESKASSKKPSKPQSGLPAVLRSAAADEALFSSQHSEASRRAFGEGWACRSKQLVSSAVDAYIEAAWGKALDAMTLDSNSPPGKNLTEKQRQVVKDKFSCVNLAFEHCEKCFCNSWVMPRGETSDALRTAVRDKVVVAYKHFYKTYVNSGFTKKHPEKYIKRLPEEVVAFVEGLFRGAD